MMIFSICRLKVAEVTVDIIYNLEAVMMELRIQHPHEIVAATNLAAKVDEIIDHFIFVYSSNFRIMQEFSSKALFRSWQRDFTFHRFVGQNRTIIVNVSVFMKCHDYRVWHICSSALFSVSSLWRQQLLV